MKRRYAVGQAALAGTLYVLCTSWAAAATDNGTLTKATASRPFLPPSCPYLYFFGYNSGVQGSYSPTGLTGGPSVSGLQDFGCGAVSSQVMILSASDPGATWLTSVTCNGVTRLGSAATTYSYSSGKATWTWSGATFGFSALTDGTNVSCAITHN